MPPGWKSKWSLTLGIAMAGMAVGFFIGRKSSADDAAGRAHAKISAQPDAGAAAGGAGWTDARPGPEEDPAAAGASERWRSLRSGPMTPETEDRLCAYLRELGAQGGAAALKLAADATTPRQRELFRNAALHGWASLDPQAAGDWALAHVRSQERRTAVDAIAAGAVVNPEEAIRAFRSLIDSDPLLASDHGNALVGALARTGRFDIAAAFADSGAPQFRAAWLSHVYHTWAVCQPEIALAGLDTVSDSAARREALSGLFAGWGSSDPAGLVAYAQTLPAGESRLEALREGLTQWVYRDSAAASDWMDKFDPSPDLDAGAAAIAVMPALVEKKPDVAASWAESISDPELRAHTLLDLIRLWAEHDADGAYRYANSSPALRPETRALALSILQPSP